MGTKGLIFILLSVALTGCATSRIGGSYSAQSSRPPDFVAKSISDSLKSAGYSAKYRSINRNGSIVLIDNLLVSGIIIIETNEEYETGRIVHLRTDIQLRLFASADRLYKAITSARGVALRNENEYQQGSPAYPPQSVGPPEP